MANSLFNLLGGNSNLPFNNLQDFLIKFNQFKSSFTGNPQEQVQQLLNSGKMTQEQFNQLAQATNQIQSLLR